MLSRKSGLAIKKGLQINSVVLLIIGLFTFLASSPGNSSALELSDQHVINIDPVSKKMIGEKVWGEIHEFFTKAEVAIETENMSALMDLYSDNYKNGLHDKSSIKRVWKRMFEQLNNMATIHNMRFITTTPESNVMIIRCSGLLLGVPAGERNLITIDNWTDGDHVLVKEKGKWKLMGTTGKERKRFWFDKPMHPLF